MNLRRPVLVLLALLALSACGQGVSSAPPSAPSTHGADPRALLTASTAGIIAGNYRYTAVMPGMKLDCKVDLGSRSWAETTVVDDPFRQVVDMVVIGQDEYTRRDTGRPWEHIDISRVAERFRPGLVLEDPDHAGVATMLSGVQSATMDGTAISGVLDGSLALTARALNGIQSRVMQPLPFTAKLDDQGRLIQLVLSLPERQEPKLPAGTWTIDITGYGSVAPPKAPAKYTEAPEDLYQI